MKTAHFHTFISFLFLQTLAINTAFAQCVADDTVFVGNYFFQDTDIIIQVGESVAFFNVGGTHDIDGITNAQTGAPYNNPEEFLLPAVEGSIDGTCMGVVTLTEPGTYNYNSGVGFDAELGMTGTITVDIFTIPELLTSLYSEPSSLDIFQGAYAFSLFCGDTLNQPNQYTVFVPNNAAIGAIGEELNLNQSDFLGLPDFTTILEYHIAQGAYLAGDLVDGMQLPSIMGQDLAITEVGGQFFVDDAQIIATNYLADNGVVHIIDAALAPEGVPEATVMSIISDNEEFSLFEEAVRSAYLDDDLIGQPTINTNGGEPGPFTVFAPTNAAMIEYADIIEMSIEELLTSQYIEDIVNNHIVESEFIYQSGSFSTEPSLENNLGELLSITVDLDSLVNYVNDVNIVNLDLLAFNGVVHAIDEVLPVEMPSLEGTCGTWTATLSGSNESWNGSQAYLVVDGDVITAETVNGGFLSSFSFPVDFGSVVDIVYLPDGSSNGESISVTDISGQVIAQSSGEGLYGLEPCEGEPNCGELELTLYGFNGSGFDGAYIDVLKDGNFFTSIQYWFSGDQLTMPIEIDSTESISLVYYQQGFGSDEFHGYVLKDSEGNVIIDQNESGQVPQSVYDIVLCEYQDPSGIIEAKELAISVYPNPSNGTFTFRGQIPSSKCNIIVTDSQGRDVRTEPLNQQSFNLDDLSDGLYGIALQTNGSMIWSGRVVIIH
ncbi:MAG: putative surface protein with fasciclin (FAS1) repeats/plastocyanin [Bacteroidia bacterium]|jgi:uncharacterized surface protein with fasciclin (FAS1) repeats/plastocyanin